MNQNGDDNPFCYFHPKEKLVGVCAYCLKERLVILAAKQGHLSQANNGHQRKSSLTLQKIFALSFFLHRPQHNKSQDFDQDTTTSTSREDSFISIKFGDNGVVSWDKDPNTKLPLEASNMANKVALPNKVTLEPNNEKPSKGTVIEVGKPHASSLWWRKRVGQLFQLVRRKTSASKVGGGVKVRKGWIRSLTKKKRTME